MYCDTHGLNLPCKQCLNNRYDELDYLKEWEKMSKENNDKEQAIELKSE